MPSKLSLFFGTLETPNVESDEKSDDIHPDFDTFVTDQSAVHVRLNSKREDAKRHPPQPFQVTAYSVFEIRNNPQDILTEGAFTRLKTQDRKPILKAWPARDVSAVLSHKSLSEKRHFAAEHLYLNT